MNKRFKHFAQEFRKYFTVAVLGWQDSLVYRFNALVWVLYSVVPSLTVMLVWIAVYGENPTNSKTLGGFDLRGMMTYYYFITLLGIAATPNPEWDIATSIRDGKITPFIVRPINYFLYRLSWESSYQVVKTFMALPAFALLGWMFRDYIELPQLSSGRLPWFCLSVLGGYIMLSQMKFLLGISAFWVAEPGGFLEIWNVVSNLFAGRLLPLALLPVWAQWTAHVLPFSLYNVFPIDILFGRVSSEEIVWGLVRQVVWIVALGIVVRVTWRRGLLAYEAYGG